MRGQIRPAPITITEFSRGQLKVHRPRVAPVRKNGPVQLVKVDMRVWREAMKRADGDRSRIEVISETEVIVH